METGILEILIFSGFIFGLVFGFRATIEFGWKEGIAWYLGCQIGTPLLYYFLFFVWTLINKII